MERQGVTEQGLSGPHIGILLPNLMGGGAERVCLTLARVLFERGYRVDLVLLSLRGHYRTGIPEGIRLYHRSRKSADLDLLRSCHTRGIELETLAVSPLANFAARRFLRRTLPEIEFRNSEVRSALRIASYLRKAKPHLLFSALAPANNASMLAAELTGHRIPHVVSIRNNVSMSQHYIGREKLVARTLMPRADAVVAISHGVAVAAVETLGIDARCVHIIHNPIPLAEIQLLAMEEADHFWFEGGNPPVVLSVLREGPQKDWATLVTAFGQVRRKIDARLAILGRTQSPTYWAEIMSFANKLEVGQDVAHLGFDENPFRYMRRAKLFVHSSRWEGFGNVLVEAMACGTPVVSTDSPYGPSEILEVGRWGKLTPVGDAPAMAQAIIDSLQGEVLSAEALRHRAECFSAERAADAYDTLFASAIRRASHSQGVGKGPDPP